MGRDAIAIILACLFINSSAVIASEAGKSPGAVRLMGIFAQKKGVWSEYALFDNFTGKRTVMRMSIVGVENDSYWYETIIKEGEGIKVVKMMITGDPIDPHCCLIVLKTIKTAYSQGVESQAD